MCDVLVLDGEMLLRELLIEVLADAGLAARDAETVWIAREMLRAHDTKLLVADNDLPEGDGKALAREAMRLYPGLLVVYTGGQWEALRELALTPRERVLPKPFQACKLAAIAQELIGPRDDGGKGRRRAAGSGISEGRQGVS